MLIKYKSLAILGGIAMLASPQGACDDDRGTPSLRVADWTAPVAGNPDTALDDWQPDCGPGFYPCPPYGRANFEVLKNHAFPSANVFADQYANADGELSLADLYQSDKKLLWVFVTAGW